MPSPCEVIPEPAEMIVMSMPGTAASSRGKSNTVIPAIVGIAFAGVLLVGLGCTPMFKPATAKAAAEQPIIIKSQSDENSKPASPSARAKSKTSANSMNEAVAVAPSASMGGVATIAAASSTRGGVASAETAAAHGFTIDCNPAHENEDSNAARPESVALQGIMAGQNSKAALLDGVLYREGDRFGSRICPWTVAMISVSSVRIEKAFGDRTCGVTIRFQPDQSGAAGGARASAIR